MRIRKSKRNKVLAVKLLKMAKEIMAANPEEEVDPEEMKISQIKKEIFSAIKAVPITKSDRLGKLLPDLGTVNMKMMKAVDFMELFLRFLRAKGAK